MILAIYYTFAVFILLLIRQASVIFLGNLSDVFIVGIPCLLWLQSLKYENWFLLIIVSLLSDLLINAVLPFYTLTSIASLIVLNYAVLPYFSYTTLFSKLIIFTSWLLMWKLIFISCLALGWFVGGAQIDLEQPIFWWLLEWMFIGFLLAIAFFGLNQIYKVVKKRRISSYG